MAIAKENKVVHGSDLVAVGAGIRKAYPRAYVGSCPTAAATAAKVVTVETFPLDANNKPLVGTTIVVKFSNTNTGAAPTLNVNGTGAFTIWYDNAAYTAGGNIGGYANRYTTYTWDGTYWVWNTHGTAVDISDCVVLGDIVEDNVVIMTT